MEQQPQFTHGTNQLTNTLKGIMGGIAKDAAAPQIDIGKINSDYSLVTNSFPRPIPQKEWSVCRSLLYDPRVPLTETFVTGLIPITAAAVVRGLASLANTSTKSNCQKKCIGCGQGKKFSWQSCRTNSSLSTFFTPQVGSANPNQIGNRSN